MDNTPTANICCMSDRTASHNPRSRHLCRHTNTLCRSCTLRIPPILTQPSTHSLPPIPIPYTHSRLIILSLYVYSKTSALRALRVSKFSYLARPCHNPHRFHIAPISSITIAPGAPIIPINPIAPTSPIIPIVPIVPIVPIAPIIPIAPTALRPSTGNARAQPGFRIRHYKKESGRHPLSDAARTA